MSDNIKVVVKVRPLISREIEEKHSYQWRVKNNTLYQIDQNAKDLGTAFTFDKVYDENTKTCDVYNDIAKPIVEAATAGFNGTIFAYGQTSSGKTYTMTGTQDSPGIIPLAVLNLFEIIKNVPNRDFLVRVSYIEIYNETLKDLLNVEKENIKIHESLQGIKVDATERVATCPEEVLQTMKEGEANRQTGATNMNEKSSRSHSIFQITIESREHLEGAEGGEGGEGGAGCVNVSQLNLVDLAGSERARQTGATGLRFKEGTHINKSLSALALVIKQLSEDPNKYANYRDSKLTRILQNSLGGNAKTSIICAITPAAVEETISTLQFANRAKAIKNKPEVNAVTTDATMMQSMTRQLASLRAELETKKNVEQDNYKLQKQIAAMEKLILNSIRQPAPNQRRKQAPRRVTISTLHSIREDTPPPQVPKFCTPALKYNPMTTGAPEASDFVPIQNCKTLSSLPEEPPRLVTPPPQPKKVSFEGEVIELDSDDDDCTSQVCSPYHACRNESKTPPCILRKTARLAEKNYKDMVQFTEREKIYTPSAIEFVEKLEQNASVISKLQDEMEVLIKQSKEKDFEVDQLKNKIRKTEENVKSITSEKAELEAQCKDFAIKVTDWEVSFETLKKRSKRREEELLSLLDEEKAIKSKNICKTCIQTNINKLSSNHLENMSQDTSDTDSNFTECNDDTSSENFNTLIKSLQKELSTKNETIIELESNLCTQRQRIEFLENSTQELEEMIKSVKDKLTFVEDENSLLKTTVDTLNSTIKSQKTNLENANNDIESYDSVIKELKMQLIKKDELLNIDMSDSLLEDMIANEEKFIANNENIKNVIHSLRLALETRNREINELKRSLESNLHRDGDDKYIKDLEVKNKEIDSLTEEVHKLEEQIKENIVTIDKLIRDKNNFTAIEQNLTTKILDIEDHSKLLVKNNEEYKENIKQLEHRNNELSIEIDKLIEKEQNILKINEGLINQSDIMKDKITELEKDILTKNDRIISLDKESQVIQLQTAEFVIKRIHNLLAKLTENIQDHPVNIDSFANIPDALNSNLNHLESVFHSIISERDALKENANILKKEIDEMKHNHDAVNELNVDLETSKESERGLPQEISRFKSELEILVQQKSDLETNLKECENKYVTLQHDLMSKENIVSLLRETEAKLLKEKEDLLIDINQIKEEHTNNIIELNGSLKLKDDILDKMLQDKDELTQTIAEMQLIIEEKQKEIISLNDRLKNTYNKTEQVTGTILEKVLNLEKTLNNENIISIETIDKSKDIYETIILSLDKMANCVANVNDHDHKELSSDIVTEVTQLRRQNLKLMENLQEIYDRNNKLVSELENVYMNNKTLNANLINSSELLSQLRDDLQTKSSEIQIMENKVKEWKEQFEELDISTKEQLYELRLENTKLKSNLCNTSVNRYEMYELSDLNSSRLDCSYNKNIRKSMSVNLGETRYSPKSLVTICCSTIMDHIQPKNDSNNVTTSSSDTDINVQNNETQVNTCLCNQLKTEVAECQNENAKLIDIVEQLKFVNQQLIDDREEVRKEIDLLLEPVYELQKKVVSHKTNLSILTATTYAENKSLQSQVKSLQHHHNRFHTVCQRDIPAFKRQLRELLTILKGNSIIFDTHNVSFKRYSLPDVLDNNTSVCNLKNESTLDEDLLMLDTNVTLTTVDNTLVGCDQTCLDLTQILFNEASCQTCDTSKINEQQKLYAQMEVLNNDNQSMLEKLEILKNENRKLREQVDKYSGFKTHNNKEESSNEKDTVCNTCKDKEKLWLEKDTLEKELQKLSDKLLEAEKEKREIEQKHVKLSLEVPSTETLMRKISTLGKDYNSKISEFEKLMETLKNKNLQIKDLQEENDSLSTQVFDNVSEIDHLSSELKRVKQMNIELFERCTKLEESQKPLEVSNNLASCSQCVLKDKFIQSMQSKGSKDSHSKLNKSYSDSETSSRYNKICTLQSELNAGREDCLALTEDVKTIKHHLERSNISMDLDETMGDSNTFTLARDTNTDSPQLHTSCMPGIPEERSHKLYANEKMDCLNYYIEKMGIERENINTDVKIIDIMKMFYNSLVAKHGNEVENLVNKLKDYEESKIQLQSQISHVKSEYSKITKELEDRNNYVKKITDVISLVKNNVKYAEIEISKSTDDVDIKKSITIIKDNLLSVLDNEFSINSVGLIHIFIDKLVTKQQTDLSEILSKYTKLQRQAEMLTTELTSVNENLVDMRRKLTDKENEYNLLKAQKERIHEISNAVTLDIIRREQQLQEIVNNYYKKLLELKIVNQGDVDLSQPLNENLDLLFGRLIDQYQGQVTKAENVTAIKTIQEEKEHLKIEVSNVKTALESKDKQLIELTALHDKLKETTKDIEADLNDKNKKLQELKSMHDKLILVYDTKVEENKANMALIEKLSEEVRILKQTISQKEANIQSISKLEAKITELMDEVKDLQTENANLNSVNEMINKERDTYSAELKKSGETIRQNNEDLDKMTADILVLRESVKEGTLAIETLKDEAKSLLKQNSDLKQQFENKCRDCSRLETNIKTHEKTAEIQSRMIIRLQKQKEDDEKCLSEKNKQLEEISEKHTSLKHEYENAQSQLQSIKHEVDELKNAKESLEARLAELADEAGPKCRDTSRRRRQSVHDAKRRVDTHLLHLEDGKVEAIFESRHRPDDLFMDVDEDLSNRSTPNRLSRGRDSLLSRTDQSDKDEEHPSRPSSVLETRRRRQSCHDTHRSVTRYTPEPHDHSRLIDDATNQKQANASNDNEVSQLRQQLTLCHQELEDLRERYKELDEECETCAEYLREREDQCIRLKKEKVALEKQMVELKKQLQSAEPNKKAPGAAVEVGVNTDEDWTKLHSLVVDRMSYDAEVEKNKKLSKTIEELRYKNQDLKNTLAKMQKALEKYSERDIRCKEMESMREEVRSARLRAAQLDQRLRDSDALLHRLNDNKTTLEKKLQEYEDRCGTLSRTHSLRKKRQTMHDLNRSPVLDLSDAATETSDDLLSYQVERDSTFKENINDAHSREIKQLRQAVEKLSQQKASLEKQLMATTHAAPHPTLYVAAGSAIVQNQQLTDVMKENQKLKKMNAKLVNICKKRGKSEANRENEDPSDQM